MNPKVMEKVFFLTLAIGAAIIWSPSTGLALLVGHNAAEGYLAWDK